MNKHEKARLARIRLCQIRGAVNKRILAIERDSVGVISSSDFHIYLVEQLTTGDLKRIMQQPQYFDYHIVRLVEDQYVLRKLQIQEKAKRHG